MTGPRVTEERDVLFVPCRDMVGLLSVDDAPKICEQVYQMHAHGSVVLSRPPSFKLDVAEGYNKHCPDALPVAICFPCFFHRFPCYSPVLACIS
jgi:hypothetical protein